MLWLTQKPGFSGQTRVNLMSCCSVTLPALLHVSYLASAHIQIAQFVDLRPLNSVAVCSCACAVLCLSPGAAFPLLRCV